MTKNRGVRPLLVLTYLTALGCGSTPDSEPRSLPEGTPAAEGGSLARWVARATEEDSLEAGGAAPAEAGSPPEAASGASDAAAGGATEAAAGGASEVELDEVLPCAGVEPCLASDSSPWVVYQADDDTPGVQEIYAVKRGLVGQMEPLKLSAPLAAGWQALAPGSWTPDPRLYLFVARGPNSGDSQLGLVYFDEQGPRRPVLVDGANPRWSASGRYVVVEEPSGIAVYENAGQGSLKRVLQRRGARDEGFLCQWAGQDQLFFTMLSDDGTTSSIFRAAKVGRDWQVSTLLDSLEGVRSLTPSPDATTLTYALRPESPLRVIDLERGGEPKVLLPAGAQLLWWSSDGSRFLALNDLESPGQTFLGHNPYRDPLERLVPQRVVVGGSFSPDGTSLLLSLPVGDWGADLTVLDEHGAVLRSMGRQGLYDGGPYWADDDDTAVLPTRSGSQANRDLSLVSVSGRIQEKLDSIAPGEAYGAYLITPRAEFVAYTKGQGASFDGVYVDLRYGGPHKPVRMPGEGGVWSFQFDDTGRGLYYIRERDDGARRCFYLDLSAQVAKPPVEIGRSGRVDVCAPQPGTHTN